MDYTRFLNYYGRHIDAPVIRKLWSTCPADVNRSGAAGLPHPCIFPFKGATFDLKDGTKIHLTDDEIEEAQQYGLTRGCNQLLDLLYKMQCAEHRPPTASQGAGPSKMRLLMSPGAQMALATIALMCCQKGVPVLLDVPSFTIVSAPLLDLMHKALCVDIDADGSNPTSLRKLLSKWTPQDAKNPESDIPRLLILNPTCNNPAGVTTSAERRKEIYAIAQEYDLLIVEDDPYYYLQENKPRTPSYLSLDVDGRVLRIDSFSKVVAPGFRCAYVTGPDDIVERMEYVFMQTCQHTSTLSQIVIYKLLQQWGPAGFEEQVQKIIRFNRGKRLHALAMADKWLTGLAEWNVPTGGMFILLRVYGTGLTSQELNAKLMAAHKFSFTPAAAFYPKDAQPDEGVAVLRIAIPHIEEDAIDKALKGLAEVIRDARLRHSNADKSDIPRLLILNPTYNNPAGVTTSAERRKEIYAIAQEYDLLIVEDDPYYYLQENKVVF